MDNAFLLKMLDFSSKEVNQNEYQVIGYYEYPTTDLKNELKKRLE